MTSKEAEARIAKLHEEKSRCMTLDFRGQKPIPYLKIDVFEEMISKAAFHWVTKSKKENGQWVKVDEIIDWKKNFIFMLGGLCGIESSPCEREREGKYSFVSKANIFRVLPSGSRETQSASYEYDAAIRASSISLIVRFRKAISSRLDGGFGRGSGLIKSCGFS